MEAIGGEGIIDLLDSLREASANPAIFEAFRGAAIGAQIAAFCAGVCRLKFGEAPDSGFLRAINIHEDEAGGIPNLVGECAIAFGALGRERDVGAR